MNEVTLLLFFAGIGIAAAAGYIGKLAAELIRTHRRFHI